MLHAATTEEIDFFKNSWCLYDFALPRYLIEGGCYELKHTLSNGDPVCDMKWYACSKIAEANKQIIPNSMSI